MTIATLHVPAVAAPRHREPHRERRPARARAARSSRSSLTVDVGSGARSDLPPVTVQLVGPGDITGHAGRSR